jgi:Na+-translocating ferredoxin:NAD+ oxidoreductase RnfC subunit
MAEHRLVPVSRLITRLGIAAYNKPAPLDESPCLPSEVILLLRQHVGAPAKPVVAVNDQVRTGDLVADLSMDVLGARLHASIDGRVTEITDQFIRITR